MESTSIKYKNIGFIGAGNMALAICNGILKKNLISPSQLYLSRTRVELLDEWKSKGAFVTSNNAEIIDNCSIIFISVKPNILYKAIKNIKNSVNSSDKLFISVLAGISLETLEKALEFFPNNRIIRSMPNTPMFCGEGCTVYCPGQNVREDDLDAAQIIFESVGMCKRVPEYQINAIAALSGSGPAYMFLIAEALADGAVKMGIPRDLAYDLTAQTLIGAGKMLLESGKHPGQLKDQVCSPGGTTIEAINELEKGGVRRSMIAAIEAATIKADNMEKNGIKFLN